MMRLHQWLSTSPAELRTTMGTHISVLTRLHLPREFSVMTNETCLPISSRTPFVCDAVDLFFGSRLYRYLTII